MKKLKPGELTIRQDTLLSAVHAYLERDRKCGENVHVPRLEETYARIEGDELATSKGARVPLDHVRRAWPVVKKIIDQGREFHANGKTIHIGHYQISEIKADGTLIAGCHRFEKAEVLRIGGLIEKP